MPIDDSCREPGCLLPRSRNSVFCHEHHAHHLWRVGLGPEHGPWPDPCRWLVDKCRRARQHYEEGRTNYDEYLSELLGVLIYAEFKRSPGCWGVALESLRPGDPDCLLAYATAYPEPHPPAQGFASEAARQAALTRWSEIHARLIAELRAHAAS